MTSGIGFSRKLGTSGIPIWQRVEQLAQGGFMLDITGLNPVNQDGTKAFIASGTPITYDESTRLAKPVKVGAFASNANATATAYQVAKGTQYKVGDNFSAIAGGAAYPITSIDTSSLVYDTITVATTLGVAVTAGQMNFSSVATGASAASFGFSYNQAGLLYDDQTIEPGRPVSVVLRATVYARRLPYSATLDTALKAAGTFIIYSQSF